VATLVGWVEPRARAWAAGGVAACAAAFAGPPVFATVLLGLAITGLAMEFIAAVGLWWSVRSASSWRSLLGTAVLGYVGGVALFIASTPLSCVTTLVLAVVTGALQAVAGDPGSTTEEFFEIWEALLPVFWSAGVALVYWWAGRSLLYQAEAHVARHDRIPSDALRLIAMDQPVRGPKPPADRPRRRVRAAGGNPSIP
jgi:hypothetical protein